MGGQFDDQGRKRNARSIGFPGKKKEKNLHDEEAAAAENSFEFSSSFLLVSAGELWENARCPVAKKGKREEQAAAFVLLPYSKPLLVLAYKMYYTTCMLIY